MARLGSLAFLAVWGAFILCVYMCVMFDCLAGSWISVNKLIFIYYSVRNRSCRSAGMFFSIPKTDGKGLRGGRLMRSSELRLMSVRCNTNSVGVSCPEAEEQAGHRVTQHIHRLNPFIFSHPFPSNSALLCSQIPHWICVIAENEIAPKGF